MPNPIQSYPILSYHILSYPIISYPIVSYPILSYPILSYLSYLSLYLFINQSIYLSIYLSSYLFKVCLPRLNTFCICVFVAYVLRVRYHFVFSILYHVHHHFISIFISSLIIILQFL